MCDAKAVADKSAAGAPDNSVKEHRLSFAALAREPEFSPEGYVVRNPPINLTKKIIEIMRGYKSGPDNFRSF